MGKNWKQLAKEMGYSQALNENELIAMKVPKGEVRGFLKKDIIINPGEAAVVIREGRIEDIITQNKVQGFGGGFGNWLGRKLGKGEDEIILFVDSAEKTLEFPVVETTKDRVEQKGVCRIKFRIDPNDAISLLKNMGHGNILTVSDLEKRFKEELRGAIFSTVGKYTAEEFHGNEEIIKAIERNANEWMQTTFKMWGLTPIKIYTNWEKSAYDELMEYRKSMEMELQRKDIDHTAVMEEMKRKHELEMKKQEEEHERELGEVIHEIKKDEIVHEHELGKKKKEFEENIYEKKSEAELAAEIARKEMENALDFTKGMSQVEIERFQQTEMAEEKMRLDHEKELKSMDVDLEKTRVSEGIQTADEQLKQLQSEIHELEMKMLDAPPEKLEILQRLYENKTKQFEKAQAEATKRQLGTVGGTASEEFMKAEAQKHNLETYKQAEDRERMYQAQTVNQSARLMEAAKQKPPQTVVQGQQPYYPPQYAPPQPQYAPAPQQAGGLRCPQCGQPVQPNWSVCPNCGYKLKETQKPRCPQCGEEVDPSWSICPNCGAILR